jgi:hypothetical protein
VIFVLSQSQDQQSSFNALFAGFPKFSTNDSGLLLRCCTFSAAILAGQLTFWVLLEVSSTLVIYISCANGGKFSTCKPSTSR